jgi:hypothetical protein
MSDVDVNGLPHPLDTIGDVELLREMVAFFGPKRFTGLLGWAVLASLLSFPSTAKEFRRELQERGLSKTSMYRALADVRDFGIYLEQRAGWVAPGPSANSREQVAWSMLLLKRMANLRTA